MATKHNLLAILENETVTFFNEELVDDAGFTDEDETGEWKARLLVLPMGNEKFVYTLPGESEVVWNPEYNHLEIV